MLSIWGLLKGWMFNPLFLLPYSQSIHQAVITGTNYDNLKLALESRLY